MKKGMLFRSLMQNNIFKIKNNNVRYFYVIPLAILALIVIVFQHCYVDFSKDPKNILHHNSPVVNTDSLVVNQLIERSISYYNESGFVGDVYDAFLREAYEIAERNHLLAQQAIVNNHVGKRLRNRAQYGEALKYHHRALSLTQNTNNIGLLADTYNLIGVVYRRTDDNALALDMHLKALRLAEEIDNSYNISVAINSIGNVNLSLGRYNSAIEYFLRGLEYSQLMNNELGQAINNNNIGECLLRMGNPDSAFHYYFKSLEINKLIGSRAGQSICYNSIGSAYMDKGELELGLDYLLKSLQINREIGDLLQVSVSLANVGEGYLLKGEFDTAKEFLEESFEIASRIGSRFQAEAGARLLCSLYEKQEDYSTALDYFRTSTAYRDSILNEKNLYHLINMETMMEAESQRTRINELNKETILQQSVLGRQRVVMAIFIILIIIMTIMAGLLVYQNHIRTKYRDLKNQHKFLRSQMNPHFIFNALSAIQVYVLENDIEKSTRFLSDFAKLMRQVLKISHFDYISIKNETEILKYYLELQRLRFSVPFEYNIHVDYTMDAEKILVPPMITQPFVENAVEHGLLSIDNGRLDIRFLHENSQIIIEVEDNGIGIDAAMKQKSEKSKSHESMALKITKERLDVIRNDSGGKVGLEIKDKKSINPFENGTIVRIILPVVSSKSTKATNNGKL